MNSNSKTFDGPLAGGGDGGSFGGRGGGVVVVVAVAFGAPSQVFRVGHKSGVAGDSSAWFVYNPNW